MALRLCRLFGIDIRLHVFFLFFLGWIALEHFLFGGFLQGLVQTVFIAALFACVLLHEIGHALMARRFGIGTRDIVLLPFGGLARLDRALDEPREEFWVAIAGPLVNVALAGAGALAFRLLDGAGRPSDAELLLRDFAVANGFLAGFNLLPAFPMDGGRILRAFLARRGSYLWATEGAVKVGRWTALAMGIGAFPLREPMLIFIALFVWFSGFAELTNLRLRTGAISFPGTEGQGGGPSSRFILFQAGPSDREPRA